MFTPPASPPDAFSKLAYMASKPAPSKTAAKSKKKDKDDGDGDGPDANEPASEKKAEAAKKPAFGGMKRSPSADARPSVPMGYAIKGDK
jgi:hypothetical protein